jgi:hypothetical protein
MDEEMKDKLYIAVIVLCGIAAFVCLSQPAWRGQEMADQFKNDCAQRHGVLIEHHQPFGITLKCESRLDGQPN